MLHLLVLIVLLFTSGGLATYHESNPSLTVAQPFNLTAIIDSFPACSKTCFLPIFNTSYDGPESSSGYFCTNETLRAQISSCEFERCDRKDIIASTLLTQTQLCQHEEKPWIGYRAIVASILIACITYSAIALRIYGCVCITKKFFWDDWIIVATTIFLVPNTFIPIYLSYYSLGYHFWDVDPYETPIFFKSYYAGSIFYVVIENLPRMSSLLLLYRIFPNRRFRVWLYIVMAWEVIHTLVFLFAVIFVCDPVAAGWDPSIKPSNCMDIAKLTDAGAGLSMALSVAIMCLPAYEMWSLQMSSKKKAEVMSMFVLTSGSVLGGIVRLIRIHGYGKSANLLDPTWDWVVVVIWSQVESYMGVMCCCSTSIRAIWLSRRRIEIKSTPYIPRSPVPHSPERSAAPARPGAHRWVGGRELYDDSIMPGSIDLNILHPTARAGTSNTSITAKGTGEPSKNQEPNGITIQIEHIPAAEIRHRRAETESSGSDDDDLEANAHHLAEMGSTTQLRLSFAMDGNEEV